MHKREKYPEHYPEEYITGKVNFFGRDFIVTPEVLIPRLETEGLVRRARHALRTHNISRVIDIGTGSGIIGVSCTDIVDELIFLDISPEALSVAKQNFRAHFPEKNAQFIVSDLLENIPKNLVSGSIFLANLPYIKESDWGHMSPDTHYEPELALFGGEKTGFEMYERLFNQILEKDIHAILIIEFGFDQREIAEEVIKQYGWKYEFFPDYAGIERFCEIIF